jgi:hypothetical protein
VNAKEAGEVSFSERMIDEIPDAKTIDYWDQFDELREPLFKLPTTHKFNIKSRLEPVTIQVSTKLRMEQYPSIARPSLTDDIASTFNSISTRQGSVLTFQTIQSTSDVEYKLFRENYYRVNADVMINKYKQDALGINAAASWKWIQEHNYPGEVRASLKELFDMGFELNPINAARVHGKVEQTTKMDAVSRWFDEVNTRSIIASAYCISAVFSPMFIEVKKRFKDILKENFVYVDGMTPEQLSSHAATFGDAKWVIEDDLSKQDAATTWLILNTESRIYEDMGVDHLTLKLYIMIHEKWKWKSAGLSGVWDAMRLTGQPTTSLGNAITNLIVHNRFVLRNSSDIKLMYILGDDNVIYSNKQLNVKRHGTETKTIYNIVSKVSQYERVGQFISMLTHTLNGKIEFCPNFKRMRHRFSVCNYAFRADERKMKLEQRKISYCVMLGNIKNSATFLREKGVEVKDWYEIQPALQANAIYHGETIEQVEDHIGVLMNMLNREEPIVAKVPMYSSNLHKKQVRLDKQSLDVFFEV